MQWADARLRTPLGTVTGSTAEIVRYRYDGERVVPDTLASAALTAVSEGVPGGAQA